MPLVAVNTWIDDCRIRPLVRPQRGSVGTNEMPLELIHAGALVPGYMAFQSAFVAPRRPQSVALPRAILSRPEYPAPEDHVCNWTTGSAAPRQQPRTIIAPTGDLPLIQDTPADRDDVPWITSSVRPTAGARPLRVAATAEPVVMPDAMATDFVGWSASQHVRPLPIPSRGRGDLSAPVLIVGVDTGEMGWKSASVGYRQQPVTLRRATESRGQPPETDEAVGMAWVGASVAPVRTRYSGLGASSHAAATASASASNATGGSAATLPPVITVTITGPFHCVVGEISWAGAVMGDVVED